MDGNYIFYYLFVVETLKSQPEGWDSLFSGKKGSHSHSFSPISNISPGLWSFYGKNNPKTKQKVTLT